MAAFDYQACPDGRTVELLKKKQAGMPVKKDAPRAATPRTGANIIDLLRRSVEMESKGGRVKALPLAPSKAKGVAKKRKLAS